MRGPVKPVSISRYHGNSPEDASDLVAGEEPLEIRLKYFDGLDYREKRLAVTMRTPGHDFELVTGFLFTEGIIAGFDRVEKIFYCAEVRPEEEGNVVVVQLKESTILDEAVFTRNFYINSSCGVCGKSSLESIHTLCSPGYQEGIPRVSAKLIHRIPDLVRKEQAVFAHTGGLHASALLDLKGNVLVMREDIGRHNALDKVIGADLAAGREHAGTLLFVSGRAGFELVQKAVVAAIPVMIAVGAPSSLAVDLARSVDLTLIGFARNEKFNIYSGTHRIEPA